nr:hypothetical protein [Tanacetum cinerariifolium]
MKRLYEPDVEDQLWTHTQNMMHALVEWKLYDSCGVHHVTSKDNEIFMLIEKDYPLRKGLAIVMISYKLQGRIVGNKMHKAFPLPVMEFPLAEEVPTASEESSHCQKERDATAEKIALLLKSSSICPEHADDEIVVEDQPYADDASPMAQSPEYVPESDFEMHPEDDDDEDPKEDPVDYPADRGDDGDDEEESSEDEEDDEMDAPSAEETEPFEIDESAATPPPHPV